MNNVEEGTGEAQVLLARLRAFCFPGGEELARQVRAVKTTQRGEFRAAPGARWMPFTAEEIIEATRSSFCWNAKMGGGIRSTVVTDAYEDGRGRLVIKLGGVIPVKKMTGPEFDKGELQRYLSSVLLCPPMLLNHKSLEWVVAGPLTLRVRDREDPTGATVDIELNEQGCPLACRAERPRGAGQPEMPWTATGTEFHEREGLRVPRHIEAMWHLPDGPFSYFREELTSFAAVR